MLSILQYTIMSCHVMSCQQEEKMARRREEENVARRREEEEVRRRREAEERALHRVERGVVVEVEEVIVHDRVAHVAQRSEVRPDRHLLCYDN